MKVIKLVMPLTETLPKDGLIPPKTQPSSPVSYTHLAGHMPEDRTALVEALRYLYLAPKPDAEAAPETPAKPTRLLIVTSFFADETDAHLATLAASAKAGTLDGWEVVVKPHPYLPVVERLKNLYGGAEPPSVVDGPIDVYKRQRHRHHFRCGPAQRL